MLRTLHLSCFVTSFVTAVVLSCSNVHDILPSAHPLTMPAIVLPAPVLWGLLVTLAASCMLQLMAIWSERPTEDT